MTTSVRPLLPASQVDPAAHAVMAALHADTLAEVQRALATHAVVVVGMAQNPFPKKARRLLDAAGVKYKYLEYGSYFSQWRKRNAIKMWAGWPTMPLVFINGMLIGGADDLERLLKSGELQTRLAAAR
jgi:monothiol glutaredoxin